MEEAMRQGDDLGAFIVVSGLSGAGKTTLSAAIRQAMPDAGKLITTTTRTPRPGERDGVDYHFVTRERFLEMVDEGKFLEHEETYGRMYGATFEAIEAARRKYAVTLAVIDSKGVQSYIDRVPGCVTVFVTAPVEQLRKRLAERNLPAEELEARVAAMPAELERASRCTYRIENADGDVEEAARALRDIVARETGRAA
jgi:guanylate kinase